jgi:hypothetical protein
MESFRDVAEEVIRDFEIDGVKCFVSDRMETFGARDGQAREVCAEAVRRCDILVGIVGIRHGSHPPDDPKRSYTQLEFETATEWGLSRLMFLLDENVASRLEGAQPDDQARAQADLRKRIGEELVSELKVGVDPTVATEQDFRKRLTGALDHWVREDSFKRRIVDHSEEFRAARKRLLESRQSGGATLIYGELGTGKTTLLTALRNDVQLHEVYGSDWIVRILKLTGEDAVERVKKDVQSTLANRARRDGVPVADLWPVIIVLYLQPDAEAGRDVDEETQEAVQDLFTWDTSHAVVLAETSSRELKDRLELDLGWLPETVITLGDFHRVDDALEQMRRVAPKVHLWPQPETRNLALALGLRPISLFVAAKGIAAEARRSPGLVETYIKEQLDAIVSGTRRAGQSKAQAHHEVLVRGSIDRLSPEARDLLALMTVLNPKPAVFPDEIAVALNLGLDKGVAVEAATLEVPGEAATEEDDEDDKKYKAELLEHRVRAYKRVGELIDRGLLERLRRRGTVLGTAEELTLHPANIEVIRHYLPLDKDQREKAHERAEAFYRKRIDNTVSGSFDSRFRMEQPDWWDDAEEWIYHLSRVEPDRAGISYAALFLDAWWWWDLYVKFDFCDQLLEYAERPQVLKDSPQIRKVAELLADFRKTYPREHEVTVARLHAEFAGSDPTDAVDLEETARKGSDIIPILRKLCDHLRITELDALLVDPPTLESVAEATSAEGASGEEPGEQSDDRETRLHLLGLICLFVAEGRRFQASLEPASSALAAAEACYRRAEFYFKEEEDNTFDLAWTHYQLGKVLFEGGKDPEPVWEEAANAAGKDGDTELLANIERSRGDYLLARRDLEGALGHYGHAVFYGIANQVTSNLNEGPDAYTKAFYREICLRATKPLFGESASTEDGRLAETKRRLDVMLAPWGDYCKPKERARKLDEVFGSADRRNVVQFAGAIAAAAFWAAPGETDLGRPDSGYCQSVNDLIEKTEAQKWVQGLERWKKHREKK